MIDDHGHPFSLAGGPLNPAAYSLDIDTEPGTEDRRRSLGPGRLFQELLTVRVAEYLGCGPDEVSQARERASAEWESYVGGLFRTAGIGGIVMDPAWPPGAAENLERYAELAGCPVHPILRLEPIVDRLMDEGAGVAEIVDTVGQAMDEAASRGWVGFKTILAYRTGLAVNPDVTRQEAEASLRSDLPVRRRGKACRDFVFREALAMAADMGLPFQIHTGMGDSEIRLGQSNPLLLEELLHSPAGAAGRIVLIHGSYPWTDELAYLAATRPNVWADLSLCNIFSPLTTANRLLRLVDLAPTNRILLATDGFREPELFWFAAVVLRDAWEQVRSTLAAAGARASWLDEVEAAIFEGNARTLYGL
ncbi:MAG TPA: amidohydrolase family protein [Actinomycetota bacterium]|nr:amidohydrolase family protein [Actinomycetota bacterium]